MKSSFPQVSVILVNWNTRVLTDEALTSLRHHEKDVPLEVIVVDNASADGSVEFLKSRHPDVTFIANAENEGFARANNRGVAVARGDYVLLLNSDTRYIEEVLPACLEVSGPLSIVACRLLNADGTLQVSAETFPTLAGYFAELWGTAAAAHSRKLRHLASPEKSPFEVDWLSGAFMLLQRETYLGLGGLSETIFMYGEDMEFCWRARRKGIRCVYVPGVSLVHLGGGASDHSSFRSLVISDQGRLRAFSITRGILPALCLRGLFLLRSALRAPVFFIAGVLKRDPRLRTKALHHFKEALILSGLNHARNIV